MSNLPHWPIFQSIPSHLLKNVTGVYVHGTAADELLFSVRAKENSVELLKVKLDSGEPELLAAFNGNGGDIRDVFVSPAYVLTSKGSFYAWGKNDHGQVGNGEKSATLVEKPFLVSGSDSLKCEKIVQIAAGQYHSACLTEKGEVFTWGRNNYSQVGSAEAFTPTKMDHEDVKGCKFIKIACCSSSTLALDADGRLFGWGYNDGNDRVLGTTSVTTSSKPLRIGTSSIIKDVVICDFVCGSNYVLALSPAGQVYAWGCNANSVLGLGLTDRSVVSEPTRIDAFDNPRYRIEKLTAYIGKATSAARAITGETFVWGETRSGTFTKPKRVPGNDSAIAFCEWIKDPLTTPHFLKVENMQCFGRPTNAPSWLRQAFNNPETADLKIIVQNRPIHVHKSLLMARSTVFQKMLGSDMKEGKNGQMVVSHYSYDVYYALLRYLYIGELEIPDKMTQEEVLSLYDLANSYFEEDLKKEASDYFLKKWLDLSSVIQLYALATDNSMERIADAALELILENLSTLVKSEEFGKLNPNHAKNIFLTSAQRNLLKS